MKKIITLLVLSSAVLTGCIEESGDNPLTIVEQPVPPVDNPLTTVEQPELPDDDFPQPPVQPPLQPPVVESELPAVLYNTESTYWGCTEPGTEGGFDMVFLEGGSGEFGDTTGSVPMTWVNNGPYIEISINAEYFAQFADFEFTASGQEFTVNYVLYEGSAGGLSCTLASSNSTGSTGGTGGTGGTDDQSLLLNDYSGGELQNLWICYAQADTELLGMAFRADGSGGLWDETDYVDGIAMSWTMNSQGIDMSLVDGNQVLIATPEFEAETNSLYSDNLLLNGTDVGGIECELVDI